MPRLPPPMRLPGSGWGTSPQQYPDHRTPGDSEEHDVQVRCHHRERTGCTCQIRRSNRIGVHATRLTSIDERLCAGRGRPEEVRHCSQRDRHPCRSDQEQRFAAQSVDQRDCHQSDHHVGGVGDQRQQECLILLETDRGPDAVGVVEDHVDADELLEHTQRDTNPHDWAQTQYRALQVTEPRLVVTGREASISATLAC